MANPLYGSNKADNAIDALADAINGGVTTEAVAAADTTITITIDGNDYKIMLEAV